MKSTSDIANEATGKSYAFIIFSLEGPHNVLSKFIHIYTVASSVDQAT